MGSPYRDTLFLVKPEKPKKKRFCWFGLHNEKIVYDKGDLKKGMDIQEFALICTKVECEHCVMEYSTQQSLSLWNSIARTLLIQNEFYNLKTEGLI